MTSMPRQARSIASVSPTGPAPTTRISVLTPYLNRYASPAAEPSQLKRVWLCGGTWLGAKFHSIGNSQGLIQMTRRLDVEWAADGSRANSVAPWF